MSDTPTPPAVVPAKAPFVKKGNPAMPRRQTYHANRKNPAIRRLTRLYRWVSGKTRLTPEEKSAIAYFTLSYEVGSENQS
jgi:hypothetical protein